MTGPRPAELIDPVCGMTVNVAAAEAAGRLIEYEGRTYAFCGAGCVRAFREEPDVYAAAADLPPTAAPTASGAGLPVIDEGMRRWYESCSCCLSEAYPDIKAALDAERAADHHAVANAGICEVAEADAEHPEEVHA